MPWKGYVNHHLMKQNRLLVLEQANYRCQICGGEAVYVHHKDRSITNHEPSNLMPVCARCHAKLHGPNCATKWSPTMLRLAMMHRGLDPKDLAKASGMTHQNILHILKTGKTKNSTMRRIAEALRYPVEFFIIPEDMDDSPSVDTYKDQTPRHSGNAYDRLNQAIEERLAALGGNHSLQRYWLIKDLREYFNVRSYTLVAETKLDEAIALIKIWEPGKGFRSASVSEAPGAQPPSLDATGTESSQPR